MTFFKAILISILLSLGAVAAPEIKGLVTQHSGAHYLIVMGNKEVNRLDLLTPIESTHRIYPYFIDDFKTSEAQDKDRVICLYLPNYLPFYPRLLVLVNEKEVHMIPELDLEEIRKQIQIKKIDPTRDLGWVNIMLTLFL